MKKVLLMSFVLLLGLVGGVFAQGRAVTGVVTSGEDGSPLPGANVVVKGTTNGTITGIDGKYSLNVPQDATLIFSSIGFLTQEVVVGERSTVNLTLQVDVKQLSEVVVTGYGVQEKREITGSIASVKGDVIENLPMQSFDRAIQGRAAGVLVQSANGAPGGAVQIRIRGVGSITAGNEPLYIVDGVQMNNSNNARFASSNPLAFLNPNDIESIEILKDAAAASIYGAQAANGVVLVTTKRGKAGATKFNFNYYTGVVEPIRHLDVMNSQQFLQTRFEAVQNANPNASAAAVRNSVLTGVRLSGTLTDDEIAALQNYDWQREAYRNGKVSNYELSASGGTEKTSYFLSGSYLQQEASVIGSDMNRLTGRLSIQHKATDKLTLDQSVNLSINNQSGPFGGPNGGSSLGSASFSTPLILPFNPIYNEDGSYYGMAPVGIAGILSQNAIAVANLNQIGQVSNQAVANLSATYKIADGLMWKSMAGIDYRALKGHSYWDPRTPDAFNRNGLAQQDADWNTNITTVHTLNFNRTFGAHSVGLLAGGEYRSEEREGLYVAGDQFPSYQFRYIASAANNVSMDGFWTGFKRTGVFGRATYDFNKKYIAQFSLRYDGSSRFGEDFKFGYFPAASLAWAISEEDFLKNTGVVQQLKLRASYGTTGNDQIGNFASRGLFGGLAPYNGAGGIRPSSLENRNLRWEERVTANIGLDWSILNSRVSGAIDAFHATSKNLLLDQPVAWTNGFGSYSNNVGELVNKGLEFELSTVNVDAGGFRWNTSFNIALLDNKVTKLSGADTVLPGRQDVRIGHAVGTNFTYDYAGVNPATGRPMWYDAAGNITYTPVAGDRKIYGDNFANIFGGFTNVLSYKGLELSAFFQYEFGRTMFNNQTAFMSENGNRNFNGLTSVYEARWTEPGQVTSVPRPFNGGAEVRGANHVLGSTRLFEDASYIRLKQLTLAYNVPAVYSKMVRLNNLRVYAQGVNVLTWTKWTGFDPEFIDLGAGNNGVIPPGRTWTMGLQLGF